MSSEPFVGTEAAWIWAPACEGSSTPRGHFVLFRRSFSLQTASSSPCLLQVSADTRYRLFVNGQRASFGPCKSYPARWYYETVDIAPLLKAGRNCIAVQVLRLPTTSSAGMSLARTSLPGLIVHCIAEDTALHTDETWKVMRDESIKLVPDSEWDSRLGPPFLGLWEMVDGRKDLLGWQREDFDDSAWPNAAQLSMEAKFSPVLDSRRLTPRPIPMLPEIPTHFDNVVSSSDTAATALQDWDQMLSGTGCVRIGAQSSVTVDIESSILTTGFLELSCVQEGDGAATVKILTAECYEGDMGAGRTRLKGDRSDYRNSTLYGSTDTYICRSGDNNYQPFWWRTFRYVRLQVQTTASALVIQAFRYRSTHYPLSVQTSLSSTPFINDLWRVSLNTAKNCMHETYEDCPYYEQNQFAMDSRTQILLTYLLSPDDRLARKTIHEFHASQRDDGLLEAHYPSFARMTNIPQFSLFWVAMVHDHLGQFRDLKLASAYVGTIDGVLGYFEDRLNSAGLVGQFDAEAWPFVDWVPEWTTPAKGFKGMAVPPAYYSVGAASFNSLLYAVALLQGADICRAIGRESTAAEYRGRAERINRAVRRHCFDTGSAMFTDGPGCTSLSQHVQIFAVLSGVVSGNEAKELMLKTVTQCEDLKITKASLAMSFYLFRAAAMAGVYEQVWDLLIQPWKTMLEQNLTTWPEFETNPRSDCHGWSATPMYEIIREIVGLRSLAKANGAPIVVLEPRFEMLEQIKGTFYIGDGLQLGLEWGHEKVLKLEGPPGMQIELLIGGIKKRISLQAGLAASICF